VKWWEIVGAIASFIGVVLTIFLQPPETNMMQVGGFSIGVGELLVAIAAVALAVSTIIGKKRLSKVPLGIYSIVRTGLGTGSLLRVCSSTLRQSTILWMSFHRFCGSGC
jgi:drug/metabolite transporter (DMT)-like permease